MLASLSEDPSSISSTHVKCSQPPVTLAPGDPTPSSGIDGHLYSCAHTYTLCPAWPGPGSLTKVIREQRKHGHTYTQQPGHLSVFIM